MNNQWCSQCGYPECFDGQNFEEEYSEDKPCPNCNFDRKKFVQTRAKWIDERLASYLNNKEYDRYKNLIRAVMRSDSIAAKYNLMTLFLEHGTRKIHIENLQERLKNLYCKDESLENYIHSIVNFNPKLNSIEISTKSGRDMKEDCSMYFVVDKAKYSDNMDEYFDDADKKMQRIKDYLRIILTESKNLK